MVWLKKRKTLESFLHLSESYLKLTSVWVVPMSIFCKFSGVEAREYNSKPNHDSNQPGKKYHHNCSPKSFPVLVVEFCELDQAVARYLMICQYLIEKWLLHNCIVSENNRAANFSFFLTVLLQIHNYQEFVIQLQLYCHLDIM